MSQFGMPLGNRQADDRAERMTQKCSRVADTAVLESFQHIFDVHVEIGRLLGFVRFTVTAQIDKKATMTIVGQHRNLRIPHLGAGAGAMNEDNVRLLARFTNDAQGKLQLLWTPVKLVRQLTYQLLAQIQPKVRSKSCWCKPRLRRV